MATHIITVSSMAVSPSSTDVHRDDTVKFEVSGISSATVTFTNGNPFGGSNPFTIPATKTIGSNAQDGTYPFEASVSIVLNGMIKVGSNV